MSLEIPYLGGESRFFPDPNLVLVKDILLAHTQEDSLDVGIVGIPFDRGITSHRQGARIAPMVVREALFDCSTYNLDLDVDIGNLRITDCGNVEIIVDDFKETQRRVEAALTSLFESFPILQIIGGDHSLSYPSLKALSNSLPGKSIGVVVFDTHHDVRSGWDQNSGMWVREILEDGNASVIGENIVQIGIHGFDYSEFYRDVVNQLGITFFRPADVRKQGIERIISKALEIASNGTDAIYISVDIDVMDPPFAPGTNKPAPGGMMPWEVIEGVVIAAQHPLTRALDIMEISPPLDIQTITSDLGAEIMIQFLGGLSMRKKISGRL